MDGLAVFQRDDAKHTRFAIARILDLDPMANSPSACVSRRSGATNAAAHHVGSTGGLERSKGMGRIAYPAQAQRIA